jgi:transcriptional regulator with XRE-family HTH domain
MTVIEYHVEEITVAGQRKKTMDSEQDKTIGQRVARLRKERGLTQQELAERLGLGQSNVSDYERGVLRVQGAELIVKLTQVLDVSADELLGLAPRPRSNGATRNRRFLRRLQQLDRLPARDQQAVLRTLDAFLAKSGSE